MLRGLIIFMLLAMLCACGGGASETPESEEQSGNDAQAEVDIENLDYAADVQPIFEKFCYRCHDAESNTHEINVEQITGVETLKANEHLRDELHEMISARKMPPNTMPQPTPAEYKTLMAFIESAK